MCAPPMIYAPANYVIEFPFFALQTVEQRKIMRMNAVSLFVISPVLFFERKLWWNAALVEKDWGHWLNATFKNHVPAS